MLHVYYRRTMIRYLCDAGHSRYGEETCISFGGLRVDAAVSKEVLEAVSGNAIQAAVEAAEQMQQKRHDLRTAIELEWSRLATKHVWQLGDMNPSIPISGWSLPNWNLAGILLCRK